ncbi:hypothetical protein PACTADRAFT_21022, partial [Pachysolen tannophilus NRRL Y-2460]
NSQHFHQNEILLSYVNQYKAHPVTLKQLAGFGKKLSESKIISSANFVRSEIPIRLGLKLQEFQLLPFEVINNYHISQIYDSYYKSFNLFRKYPKIETLQENDKFVEFLKELLDDHLAILPHLVMGALEISISKSLKQEKLDEFMSTVLRSRISRRVIVEEHISLTHSFLKNPNATKSNDYIGDVFHQCSAMETLQKSANATRNYLQTLYPDLQMPELIIKSKNENGADFKFPFMLSHLHYIFGEIFRNSFKSTIEFHLKKNSNNNDGKIIPPPPIVVTMMQNKDKIVFRFSDKGGGTDSTRLSKIWSFGKDPILASESLANYHDLIQKSKLLEINHENGLAQVLTPTPLENNNYTKSTLSDLIKRPFRSRLGISLPICKVYVDYWNGDLKMYSLRGSGTDTYLSLRKLDSDQSVLQLDRA